MKHTIQKMNQVLKFQNENKEWISLNGYAFIDECGHCIMIVYGENKRDSFSEYLKNNDDPLGIKYNYVDLLP